MELTGTVFKLLEAKTGTSARTGNKWVTQSFIIEIRTGEHGQYTRKVMFSIFGEKEIKDAQLFEGKQVKVSFDIECKENPKNPGQWFNDVRAWKVEPVGTQQPQQPAPAAYTPPQQYPPQQPQNGFFQPQGGGYPPNTGFYQPQPQYQQQYAPQPQNDQQLPF